MKDDGDCMIAYIAPPAIILTFSSSMLGIAGCHHGMIAMVRSLLWLAATRWDTDDYSSLYSVPCPNNFFVREYVCKILAQISLRSYCMVFAEPYYISRGGGFICIYTFMIKQCNAFTVLTSMFDYQSKLSRNNDYNVIDLLHCSMPCLTFIGTWCGSFYSHYSYMCILNWSRLIVHSKIHA